MYTRYTPKEDAIIRDNYKVMSYEEIGPMIGRTAEAVRHHAVDVLRLKRTKEDKRFLHEKYSTVSHFKNNGTPWNAMEDLRIVTRVDNRGTSYQFIRIAPGKWMYLQRYNWIKAHGEIPSTHCLACKSADTLNCDLSNWEMISKRDNVLRNREKAVRTAKAYNKVCSHCQKKYKTTLATSQFCCKACHNAAKAKKHQPIECPYCGKLFTPQHGGKKYCSANCRKRHNNNNALKPRNCSCCGNEFMPTYWSQTKCIDCRYGRRLKLMQIEPAKPKKQKATEQEAAPRVITSVIVSQPAPVVEQADVVIPTQDLTEMAYRHVDPKSRSIRFFRTRERYEKFLTSMPQSV